MPKGQHKNVRGRDSILDLPENQELRNFILTSFMDGLNATEISKIISTKFPSIRLSRLTITRFLSRELSSLDMENQDLDMLGKTVLNSFNDTIRDFDVLFNEIKDNVNLDNSQTNKLNKIQRKVTLQLELAKKKYKMFTLQLKVSNTEIQDTLRYFINSLSGEQKRELSQVVERDLFREEQLLSSLEQRQYDKYRKRRIRDWYKFMGKKEEGVEVA